MKSRARANANYAYGPGDGQQRWAGRKWKRRKGRYLPNWTSRHKTSRTMINRRERHRVREDLRM